MRVEASGGSRLCLNCHSGKGYVGSTKHDMGVVASDLKNIYGETVREGGVCSACHVPHNGRGMRMWAREVVGSGIGGLCESCHREGGVGGEKVVGENSHPVGREVKGLGIETDLPLYLAGGRRSGKRDEGRVECSTCHDPHRWSPVGEDRGGKGVEGDGRNSFLRVLAAPVSTLCITCHREKGYVLETEHDMRITGKETKNIFGETVYQSGVCGQCHGVHNSPYSIVLWDRELGPGEDMMERLCRSCHSDGRIAEEKQPYQYTHPKNILITSSTGIKKKGGYFPLYNPEGKEENVGYITCPTCHNPHRWSPFKAEKGPGKNTEGSAINSFLRNTSEFALCTDCHGIDGLFRYKYFHGEQPRRRYPPGGGGGLLIPLR